MRKLLYLLILFPLHAYTQTITTFAGIGISGYTGDGIANTVRIGGPAGMAMGSDGSVFIADGQNNCILRVDKNGYLHTIAGTCKSGCPGFFGEDVPGLSAKFCAPQGIAVDNKGNVYITDNENNRIRKLDSAGIIHTIAGNGALSTTGDGGPATAATVNAPWGILLDSVGNLFFSEQSGHCVRKIATNGIISTVVGIPDSFGFFGDGGPATAALIGHPNGIAMDCKGNLYISDMFNCLIRKVDQDGIITTFAGVGVNGYTGDGGPATAAKINVPFGIAADKAGNVYFSDVNNRRVRMISPTGIMSTIAGIGICTTLGDGAPATGACLTYPLGLMMDDDFNIYIGDQIDARVRKITGVRPGAGTIYGSENVCAGSSIPLSDGVSGGVWSASNSSASVLNGTVMGISNGIDTITYSIYGGYCPITAYKIVSVDAVPSVGTLSGDSVVCVNQTITLSPTVPGGVWSKSNHNVYVDMGDVTGSYAGPVLVYYILSNDCGSDSASKAVVVPPVPDPGTITGPSNICQGDTITLMSTTQGGSWNITTAGIVSVTGAYFTGHIPGIDTAIYTITNSCGTATINYLLTVDPLPGGTISKNSYSLSVPDTFTHYQWTLNGTPIPQATTNVYTYSQAGAYSVMVTDAHGCSTALAPFATSDCSVSDILVNPSITNGIISIQWCKPLNATISCSDGKIVSRINNASKVDISNLPAAVYFLTLYDSGGTRILTKRITRI